MARVVLDANELGELLRSEYGYVGRMLTRTSQRVLNSARQYCPVDTGNLRASLAYEIGYDFDDLSSRIGTNVPYAIYVEADTNFLEDSLTIGLGSVSWV